MENEPKMEKLQSVHVVSLVCVVGAVVVAATGHDGWGWLLFVAFMELQCSD